MLYSHLSLSDLVSCIFYRETPREDGAVGRGGGRLELLLFGKFYEFFLQVSAFKSFHYVFNGLLFSMLMSREKKTFFLCASLPHQTKFGLPPSGNKSRERCAEKRKSRSELI